ncbi:uncharacterized protein [Periplaneta americana]|uniref:uncharacterized protein n=1 Tax=Periplaneta americana TaxID=6978 RepID=UPI0037E8AC45
MTLACNTILAPRRVHSDKESLALPPSGMIRSDIIAAGAAIPLSRIENTVKMEKVQWTRERVRRLIGLIKMKSCLWDVASPDYKNKQKRHNAVTEIGLELQTSPEAIKQKIHSLRSQFTSERNKVMCHKSESGAVDTYKIKWEYYDALGFMFRHVSKDVTQYSISTVSEEGKMHRAETPSDDIQEDESTNHNPLPSTTSPTSPRSTSRKGKRKKNIELEERAAINRCMSVFESGTGKQTDEFHIFGEYVANELRVMKNDYFRYKMKNAIQQAIVNVSEEYANSIFGSQTMGTSSSASTSADTL